MATEQDQLAVTNLTFEQAYERLSETAGRLERGNLSLEESLSLYEEGVLLSRHCENLLEKAQLRVSQITPGTPPALGYDDEEEEEVEEDDELNF